MIYDHELDVTLGPFPIGEWSMFVPVHYYNRVVPWYVYGQLLLCDRNLQSLLDQYFAVTVKVCQTQGRIQSFGSSQHGL